MYVALRGIVRRKCVSELVRTAGEERKRKRLTPWGEKKGKLQSITFPAAAARRKFALRSNSGGGGGKTGVAKGRQRLFLEKKDGQKMVSRIFFKKEIR